MTLRHSHTPAGKSRASVDTVFFSATKNLITDEVELSFNEEGSNRRTSISLTPDEARKLAKRITEAADGRFSFDISDITFHNA